MPNETVSQMSFALTQRHRDIINQLAAEQGTSSASAALRRIIDEWAQIRAERRLLVAEALCDEERDALTLTGPLPALYDL